MPSSPGGGYTPISAADKGALTSTMEVYLRQHPNASSTDAIIYAVGRTGIHVDNSDDIVLRNLYANAAAADAAGAAAGQQPGQAPDPGIIPTVFGDPADSGLYVTTYVIEATDTQTGQQITTQEQRVDPAPVSAGDIQADTAANIRSIMIGLGYPGIGDMNPDATRVDVIILSVVRVR